MKRVIAVTLLLFAGRALADNDTCAASTNAPNNAIYQDGQLVPLSCDKAGNLRTTSGSGGGNTVAPTAAGTSATTANPVQGVTNGVPVPITDPDTGAAGSITATDTVVSAPTGDGTFRTGTSTPNSYVVAPAVGGDSTWAVSLNGTLSGTYYFEGSVDSTTGIDGNWIATTGRQNGSSTPVMSTSSTVVGFFRGNTAGFKYFRVRNVGGTSPNTNVVIRISSGPDFLTSSQLPVNLGQKTTAQSLSVTFPSDQSTNPIFSSPFLGTTLTTNQQSITTTASQIFSTATNPVTRLIYNTSTSLTIYVGASGVTSSTGYPVPPLSQMDVSKFSGAVYGIAASGAVTIAVLNY